MKFHAWRKRWIRFNIVSVQNHGFNAKRVQPFRGPLELRRDDFRLLLLLVREKQHDGVDGGMENNIEFGKCETLDEAPVRERRRVGDNLWF